MNALEKTLYLALQKAAQIISNRGVATLEQRAQIFDALKLGADHDDVDNAHHPGSDSVGVDKPSRLVAERNRAGSAADEDAGRGPSGHD